MERTATINNRESREGGQGGGEDMVVALSRMFDAIIWHSRSTKSSRVEAWDQIMISNHP